MAITTARLTDNTEGEPAYDATPLLMRHGEAQAVCRAASPTRRHLVASGRAQLDARAQAADGRAGAAESDALLRQHI